MANTDYTQGQNPLRNDRNSNSELITKNKLGVLAAAINIVSKGEAKIVKIEKIIK